MQRLGLIQAVENQILFINIFKNELTTFKIIFTAFIYASSFVLTQY